MIIRDEDIPYKEIIDDLNAKSGREGRQLLRPETQAWRKMIHARFAEGYSLDDFKHVHSVKCMEWLGTEMEVYLTPATLYRPANFAKYASQRPTPQVVAKATKANMFAAKAWLDQLDEESKGGRIGEIE